MKAPAQEIVTAILTTARRLVQRGYVHNTLGNIAVRCEDDSSTVVKKGIGGIIYTKHRGVSLEEMSEDNIVGVDIDSDVLVFGNTRPSIGNKLNREIFRCRPDVGAVIHVHPNLSIALFSVHQFTELPFIGIDAPLVLGAPVLVLPADSNVERDTASVPGFIEATNCFIMPNHGITALGIDLPQAYHRLTSVMAEIERIVYALLLSNAAGHPPAWVSAAEVAEMFASGNQVIYGSSR